MKGKKKKKKANEESNDIVILITEERAEHLITGNTQPECVVEIDRSLSAVSTLWRSSGSDD